MQRSSCFSFEAAHSYFKELGRKQNFKNFALSLPKRHQFLQCVNFGDAHKCPSSHPLFATENKFGVLRSVDKEKVTYLRQRFNCFGLLPGI